MTPSVAPPHRTKAMLEAPQKDLLDHLPRSTPGLIETFVPLYRFFTRQGVSRAEQWAADRGYILPEECFDGTTDGPDQREEWVAKLEAARDPREFDACALAMLCSLDRSLRDVDLEHSDDIEDAEGVLCLLFRSDRHLVEAIRPMVAAADRQAGYLQRHVRFHTAVPREPQGGLRWVRDRDSLPAGIRRDLQDVRRDNRLTVLLRPFKARPSLETDCAKDGCWVRVHGEGVSAALANEIPEAVREASGLTILVLPELALTNEGLALLQKELREADKAPLLTVAGLVHLPDENGCCINEAVLLDAKGGELARHRKLRPFGEGEGDDRIEERLLRGEELRVLESPIGSLGMLICYDLLSDIRSVLEEGGPDLLLVPSLSSTTSAHIMAAGILGASRRVVTFVTNWDFQKNTRDSASFVWIQAGGTAAGLRPLRAAGASAAILFDLARYAE